MKNMDFFRLWTQSEFKHLYPSVTEYPELPPFREVFGVPRNSPAANALEGVIRYDAPTVARYNFRNNELREQFQVQRDRIGYFWQRGDDPTRYPRFPYVLEKFRRDVRIFSEFVEDKDWGSLSPNHCAIWYNNRIFAGDGWDGPENVGDVVNFWCDAKLGPTANPKQIEDMGALIRATVSEAGKPVARMYVSVENKPVEPDMKDALEIELLVRGPANPKSVDGAVRFFEMGRREIVKTFEAVTTPRMHQLWGKQ